MNVAIKWGVILGVVVAVFGFIFGGGGLHTKGPMMALVFVGLAIVLNIVAVVLALREAKATTPYGGQLLNGLILGVVGAVIIFVGSWLMTSMVFPDYYSEMKQGYLEFFEGAGIPQDQIDAQMQAFDAATPVSGAMQGAIGTVITSLVVAAIGGIFLRKK